MIVVKLTELVNAVEATKNILTAKLPIKVAFQLSRIGKVVQAELATFEEHRQKLMQDLGTPSPDGARYDFIGASATEFQTQMNDLLATEIKIDQEPVKVSDFGDKAEVSAVDLMACEKFITA